MDSKPTPRRGFARVFRWVKVAAIAYAGVCSVFYFLQNLMIFPGKSSQGHPDARVLETATTRLVQMVLPDGTPIVARFDRAPTEPNRAPTILLFYGNGQCARTSEAAIQIFQQLGCNVLTPDYPGYGMSGGTPSEHALYATADACWKYLQSRDDLDKTQLYIVGWSLGTGVAIDLAARVTPQSLITISAYTSMLDMGRKVAPYLPVSLILKHHFHSIDKIAQVRCPILMIHGEQDTIIPAEMTRQLAARAMTSPKMLFLTRSGHNDVFDTEVDQMISGLSAHLK